MQSLLNEATTIPSLLRQSDALLGNRRKRSSSNVTELISRFVDSLNRFDNWETALFLESDGPLYWQYAATTQGAGPGVSEPNDLLLWYPNVTMANVFTYLWAFRITCLAEVRNLTVLVPRDILEESQSSWKLGSSFDHIQTRITALAKLICQRIDYLLQDEMKLFGPASTFFPLRMAYRSLQERDVSCIESVVDRVARKGLRSSRAFIFDD